jgi:hypothetical protein
MLGRLRVTMTSAGGRSRAADARPPDAFNERIVFCQLRRRHRTPGGKNVKPCRAGPSRTGDAVDDDDGEACELLKAGLGPALLCCASRIEVLIFRERVGKNTCTEGPEAATLCALPAARQPAPSLLPSLAERTRDPVPAAMRDLPKAT